MFTVQEYTASHQKPLRYGVFTDPKRPRPEDKGKQRALLYIPGLGGSVKGAIEFLESLLPAFDVIYGPDLRGFGMNCEEKLPDPHIFLKDLRAFEEAMQLDQYESVTLAGISLGAVLATHLATESPQRYNRLMLIAPAYKASPVMFTTGYILKNVLGRIFRGKNFRTTLPYSVEALTRNPAILNDPQYQTPPLSLPADFLLQVRDVNEKALKKAKHISQPTFYVVPGKDIVCDPHTMRLAYGQIPHTTPKVCHDYPELFHDVLMEVEQEDIAQKALQWLQQPAVKDEILSV